MSGRASARGFDGTANLFADNGVQLHLVELPRGQAGRLEQNRIGNADVADVVQQTAPLQILTGLVVQLHFDGDLIGKIGDALGVTAQLHVAGFDGRHQSFDDGIQHFVGRGGEGKGRHG